MDPNLKLFAEEILETLGAGHTESVYHQAFKICLQDKFYKFESERDILISFRGRYVGTVRADLIINNSIVVELKASTGTETVLADATEQCLLYMKETQIQHGCVIIFPKRKNGKLVVQALEL